MFKSVFIIILSFNFLFTHKSADFVMGSTFGLLPMAHTDKNDKLEMYANNKSIPDPIREVTLEALSHFPDLMDTRIDFEFKKKIGGSVMQAQPRVGSLVFKGKENRAYRIKISRYLELEDENIPIEELPHDVLLGWIGHELGHIQDYLNRSAVNLMGFGMKYYCSKSFVTEAEITADSYAVSHGLGEKIIATKNFVLNHERLPDDYKNKIRALYMSPGEILSLVEAQEEDEDEIAE
ncbi:hypothetical protein [Pleomorphovibrio marinus]|uniref:hypothetical protein n=1 Tax=Pleomorphovibrio marinus TaxID=2164132 RepID=UPI000E0AAB48|nr:hypothetical protein [Pleomorphovibrio marinus]